MLRYFVCLLLVAACSTFVRGADRPNILLICIDDLRPELNCYGVDYIRSPNIDALAAQGRIFCRHYVQAPTCGASRFALLTGRYGPHGNAALFDRSRQLKQDPNRVPPSMPAWFRQHGYTTVSVGKVSHHPGGRGGRDWDDAEQLEMPNSWDRHLLPAGPWQHPRGWMHGLANGEIRDNRRTKYGGIEMDVLQAVAGPDSIYPDGVSMDEALHQMQLLTEDSTSPFFLAVGILRPHLPFGCPAEYLQPYLKLKLPPTPHPAKPSGKTTWHGSGEFMKYDRGGRNPNEDAEYAMTVRRHYAACVSYADAQVGRLMTKLKASGQANNTVVVLWGDHGWHLGEHAVWGKHTLFEESLRAPLIISYPTLSSPGQSTKSIVETIDIFPTLCKLAGLTVPEFAQGVSLEPILKDPSEAGHAACSYHRGAKTIRTDTHRLVLHRNGNIELYDHNVADPEATNIAEENSHLAAVLTRKLKEKLSR